MIKHICDECGKDVDRLWTLEAYNEELEDYLKPRKELCRKCALNHLEVRKSKKRGKK